MPARKPPVKQKKPQENHLARQFYRTFKDRYGHLDPKALTAFISFCILVTTWLADQFFGKKLNELMVEVFAFLVFSLLGLKVLPFRKQGMLTEQEQEQSNGE